MHVQVLDDIRVITILSTFSDTHAYQFDNKKCIQEIYRLCLFYWKSIAGLARHLKKKLCVNMTGTVNPPFCSLLLLELWSASLS